MKISAYKQEPYLSKGTKSLDIEINTCPHYTDSRYRNEQTEFCLEPESLIKEHNTLIIPGLNYNYSDRLYEWDSIKYKEACDLANKKLNIKTNDWRKRATARYLQEFLRYYFDKPLIELVHVLAGVNRGNGYPYLIYGHRENKPL